jgi:geranylgeranyl pyrophosphate synthase
MTTALVLEPTPPLIELFDEQFSTAELEQLLGPEASGLPWSLWQEALHAPLREFLGRRSKQIRARLVGVGWSLAGRGDQPPFALPLVVELLHAGSLIHDDIEDGSAFRRGAPAFHCAYGLPRALNAGSWLYFLAQALLAKLKLEPERELSAHRLVTNTLLAAHTGQALDLSACVYELDQTNVAPVVRATTELKTGRLTEFAVALGALVGGTAPARLRAVQRFGCQFGVALQMLDDLSGLISDRHCHKAHEDLRCARPTWPWAWLSKELDASVYSELATQLRALAGGDTHPESLCEKLVERLGAAPERRAREHLQRELFALRAALGTSESLGHVEHEIACLERDYV